MEELQNAAKNEGLAFPSADDESSEEAPAAESADLSQLAGGSAAD